MPVHDHIDVRVTINGRPLQEYPPPDSEETKRTEIVRYIGATVGQRFMIHVRWLPGFELKGAVNLVSTLRLDNEDWVPTEPVKVLASQNTNDILNEEREYILGHASVSTEKGLWKNLYYTFAPLELCMCLHAPLR